MIHHDPWDKWDKKDNICNKYCAGSADPHLQKKSRRIKDSPPHIHNLAIAFSLSTSVWTEPLEVFSVATLHARERHKPLLYPCIPILETAWASRKQ